MTGDFPAAPSFFDGTVTIPGVPSFIRAYPEVQGRSENPFELFNYWAPKRYNDPVLDYAAGERHCLTALHFAVATGATHIVANTIGGMMCHGAGPMERGFIDVLARKATYGRPPNPIDEEMLSMTVRFGDRSAQELRAGERDARDYLDLARECRYPEIIADFMVGAVNSAFGYGSLTFIWTVCGAACLGSLG